MCEDVTSADRVQGRAALGGFSHLEKLRSGTEDLETRSLYMVQSLMDELCSHTHLKRGNKHDRVMRT